MHHLKDLQKRAKLIAQAATWASQEFFPANPIFFGPVVEADVVYAGFIAADV